jgi:adenine C2-methylase RlmN of 23S rRNA A2503 and tRNA A37
MKRKDVKKLSLSRETLSALDDSRLEAVAGGATRPLTLCVSCKTECTANCA